jgi:hypothetical protein
MKIKSVNYSVVITILLSAFLLGCKKDSPKVVPTVTLKAVTNIADLSTSEEGEVTSEMSTSIPVYYNCK